MINGILSRPVQHGRPFRGIAKLGNFIRFLPHSSTIAAKGIRANARTTFTLRIPFSWKSIGSYCSRLDSRSTPKHRATRGIGAWPFSWLSVDHIVLSIYNFELRRFWSVRYYGETQRAKAIFFTIGFSNRFNSFCYSRPTFSEIASTILSFKTYDIIPWEFYIK